MKRVKATSAIISLLTITLFLGGCFNLTNNPSTDNSNDQEENPSAAKPADAEQPEEQADPFVSVQDYTGEGYELDGGEVTQPIADEHLPEIEEAVKTFFKDEYNTDVTVHNVVGALEAATVFVESEGEPHFYTYAVVPIDVDNQEVNADQVFSEKGQVESAITTGIYAMIYEEEIKNLDTYLNDIASNYPITGMPKEATENVRGTGFTTEYYHLSVLNAAFEGIIEKYKENPGRTREEWEALYPKGNLDPNHLIFPIKLYMDQPDQSVDEELFKKIENDIENMENIPPGLYSIYLYDNEIDSRNLQSDRENVLKRSVPDEIVKP